eukprot:m.81030 g.81030  ORF g.81030 m.81030 type:complete len:384 (+) comp12789_c0_seq2:104-1255(+)
MAGQTVEAPDWTNGTNLASEQLGAKVLFATDEWFAAAKNAIQEAEPVWKEGLFTKEGKWMDGWESRRRRNPGHDWCIIKLGIPGRILGIVVDTCYFTGNFVPRVSVQAALDPDESVLPHYESFRGQEASKEQRDTIKKLESNQWQTIVNMTNLGPGTPDTRLTYLKVDTPPGQRFSHVRINTFPDGGIARIKVFGETLPPPPEALLRLKNIDLLGLENGGKSVAWSCLHYGHPNNLIRPGRGVNMGDGWETARHLDRPPKLQINKQGYVDFNGTEWCILKLGVPGQVDHVIVDTCHFKGNYPESFLLESCFLPGTAEQGLSRVQWETLVPRSRLTADNIHTFEVKRQQVTHVRLTIYPDGGVSRLRIIGNPLVSPGTTNAARL